MEKKKTIKAWGVLYPYSTRRLKAYKEHPFQRIHLNESVARGESTKGDKIIPIKITYPL